MNKVIQPYTSETSKHRDLVQTYCTGYGLDIGFGGDPVTPGAIRMDFPQPYAYTGDLPVQLGGDCRDLHWFRDDQLDFIYSSHVLEDFAEQETEAILREWMRVLKVGGRIVLLLPDQQRYLRDCERRGEPSNPHHSIAHFSMDYVLETAQQIGNLESEVQHPEVDAYSFVLVLKKTTASQSDSDEIATLRTALHQAWLERENLKVHYHQIESQMNRLNQNPVFKMIRSLYRLRPRRKK